MNSCVYNISSELFLIPEDRGTYLVYAPANKFLMRLDARHVNMLNRIREGKLTAEDKKSDFTKSLLKHGILNGKPDDSNKTPLNSPYAPTQATLFLTNQCNLGCRYCYAAKASSGELVLPREIGFAAVDFVVGNCMKKKLRQFTLAFHGGGEQTTAWDRLVKICDYSKGLAKKHGINVNIGLASNGVFSEQNALWMVKNLSSVTLSIDGPPRIQDWHRPLKNGCKSSPHVRRTIDIFKRHKFPFHIQATVTSKSVKKLPEIVRYFVRYAKPMELKFEPAYPSGRCAELPKLVPDNKEFSHFYNQAWLTAKELGVKLSFSGTRLFRSQLTSFCGAFASPFSITPDGIVTSCYEICDADSEYREIFHIGKYDYARKMFAIDDKVLSRLRDRNVHMMPSCRKCFCKYSCAGDCAIRNMRFFNTDRLDMVGARCEVIRDVTRFQLSYLMDKVSEKPDFFKKIGAAYFGGEHGR